MLAASGAVSRAIAAELKKDGPGTSEAAARRAYQALWPSKAKLQRDFHVFGGEFLMAQPAPTLRGFFNGFFKLPLPLWAVRNGVCSVLCCASVVLLPMLCQGLRVAVPFSDVRSMLVA